MFVQVEDIEASFVAFKSIANFEEKPLWVTIRIYVILEEEIVLVFSDFADEG